MLRHNEDLNKKLQELQMSLTNTNEELRKTKDDLETARNVVKKYKEKNTTLEDKISQCNKEHLQSTVISSRQKDVMMITFCDYIFYVSSAY